MRSSSYLGTYMNLGKIASGYLRNRTFWRHKRHLFPPPLYLPFFSFTVSSSPFLLLFFSFFGRKQNVIKDKRCAILFYIYLLVLLHELCVCVCVLLYNSCKTLIQHIIVLVDFWFFTGCVYAVNEKNVQLFAV